MWSAASTENIDVSVIIPVYNGEQWLEECLQSVLLQDFSGNLELSIYNDASTDATENILNGWSENFAKYGIKFTLNSSNASQPKGVGFAKNQAVRQSYGNYLCFLDADDVMHIERIRKQYKECHPENNVIVGCQFHRLPEGSTSRYTKWANNLSEAQLYTQMYTSFGPTVVMPTWFCHRDVFSKVGGFVENGKGTPEDLLFFYDHLRLGGKLKRFNEDLMMYRYHPAATTFSVPEESLWDIRLKELEENVLNKWIKFTIWNAGKQGRKFYRCLSSKSREKVDAFCDVDQKKLSKGVYIHEESEEIPKPRIPIVHFSNAKPPLIICVKLDLTKGEFEKNLLSLNLVEGIDYFHFN